jgi:hypothetical protein
MFKIACFRSSASVFGSASAYAKSNGVELTWPDRESAQIVCDRYNASTSPNVSYRVVEVVDGVVVSPAR